MTKAKYRCLICGKPQTHELAHYAKHPLMVAGFLLMGFAVLGFLIYGLVARGLER